MGFFGLFDLSFPFCLPGRCHVCWFVRTAGAWGVCVCVCADGQTEVSNHSDGKQQQAFEGAPCRRQLVLLRVSSRRPPHSRSAG